MTPHDPLPWRPFRSRRLVLGAAFAAGLACALLAAGDRPAFEPALVSEAIAAEAKDASPQAGAPDTGAKAKTPTVDAEISIGEGGISIRKNRGRDDHEDVFDHSEFDSFEEFVEKAPWLAALVFMVTGLVFLIPLLIIVLIIWYKMRSNRMRNETMLKLAERGVVATPETMIAGAVSPGQPPIPPLYEQVRQGSKRAAWSDLRKGVVMLGIGVGLTFFSMLDDGTPNSVGLILLFVGIGFVVLWYFEDRRLEPTRDSGTGRPPGGGV